MAEITQQQLEAWLYRPFLALRMDLPGYTARLWTGDTQKTLFGAIFEGAGRLLNIGPVEGSAEASAPALSITLSGLPQQDDEDNDLLAELIEYVVKGSPARLWFGLLDDDEQVAADPELIYSGRLDAPRFTVGATASVTVDVIGGLEWAMKRGIVRWNPAHHEAAFPGDIFFEWIGREPQPFAGATPAPSR